MITVRSVISYTDVVIGIHSVAQTTMSSFYLPNYNCRFLEYHGGRFILQLITISIMSPLEHWLELWFCDSQVAVLNTFGDIFGDITLKNDKLECVFDKDTTLSPCSQNVKSIAYKMLVRPQLEYASEVWSPYTMKCIKKIEQIQRNSCRFIFHEYRRDTDTSLLVNRLNLYSLYARRLIQQATMFYKIHHSLVDICPPSYIQHANHISIRTDHPLKYCNKNPLQINAYKYSFFPGSMNIWNRLSCSAVSHVIPFVDNFHKFAIPAIRDMQPLYGAALI